MKKIYLPMAIVVAVVLLAINLRSCVRNNKLEKENTSLRNDKSNIRKQVVTEAKIIARKVDMFGAEHVIIDATQNTYSKASLKEPVINVGILDTTAMALNIQKKQILELTRVNARLSANQLQTNYIIDSLQRRTVNYSDKYLTLKYTPNLIDSIAGEIDFSLDVEPVFTKYSDRKWFLGRNKQYVDLSFTDPRVKIGKVDRFVLEQKEPFFKLAIQATSRYDFYDNTIGAGAGANIKLGRVSLQPTYLYFPRTAVWRPTLQVNYDILKL